MKLLTPFKLLVLVALLLCVLPANAWRETGLHAIDASETSLTLSTYSLELYLNAYGDVQVESGSGSYEIINMNPDIVETEFISDGVANAKAQTPTQEGSKIDDLLSIKGIALGDAVVRVKDKNTQEVAEVKVHVGTAPHLSLSSYSQTLEVGKKVEVEVLTGSRMYQVNSSNNDIVKAVSFTRSSGGRIGPDGEPVYETHEMIQITAKAIGNAIVSVKDLSSGEVAEVAVTVKNDTPASPAISFADPEVERICVAQWDTDGDGRLSQAEAVAVASVSNVFQSNKTITSFDELRFFTGLTSISDFSFYSCTNLVSVKLPASVTEIGENAFGEDESLKEVLLPSGVRTIAKMAFFRCRNLVKVTLPNGLTTIGESAFFYCENLQSVTIPATVTSIGESAFAMLGTSPDVYCRATTPPTAAADAFNYSTARGTLHVPVGCVDAYRNAQGWKEFKNIVEFEEIDESEWYLITDNNEQFKMSTVGMLVAADDSPYFSVLDLQGNVLAEDVLRVHFLKMDPSSVEYIMVDEPQNMLKRYVNNQLTLVGARGTVNIYSVSGMKVASTHAMGQETVIDVSALPTGTYIVKCGNQSFKFNKK